MQAKGDNILSWSGSPWNVTTGCTKVSSGCANCYAERDAGKLHKEGSTWYENGFKLTLHPERLNRPLQWTEPRRIFPCSMSDLFHDEIPDDFIQQVFEVMRKASRHQFMVLTKRPHRMRDLAAALPWPPNIAAGVTLEENAYVSRIAVLRQVPAHIRYLSIEPMLGPIPDLDLTDIHWVVAGGESGPGARKANIEWVRQVRDAVKAAGLPFMFKQWGGENRRDGGCVLDGHVWNEEPDLVV